MTESFRDPQPPSERSLAPGREYYRDPRLKPPLLAGLLSLMPGLGQAYLGYTRLAFLHALAAATFIALMSTNALHSLEPLVGVLMVFFWLYNLVDAHRRALLINEALLRVDRPELPEDLGQMTVGVRLGLGILLILVGVLTFLHRHFHISLAWLAEWWPLGLAGFGLYLVVKAVKDRTARTDLQD